MYYKVTDSLMRTVSHVPPELSVRYKKDKWVDCPEIKGVKCPVFLFENREDAIKYYGYRQFKRGDKRLFLCTAEMTQRAKYILSPTFDHYYFFWEREALGKVQCNTIKPPFGTITVERVKLLREEQV